MAITTLPMELLSRMDAYWRAASYLAVGQIYLCDNPLLKRPLELTDVKHMLLGHWGTAARPWWGTPTWKAATARFIPT